MAKASRKTKQRAEPYSHEEEALLRPEVVKQAQFKKKKAPKTYRYDSSLSPALDWDGQNPAHELNEWIASEGLPESEVWYELTDPETGAAVALLDLARPNGLQEGVSQPVTLLIDEDAELESS
ncbi:MAG: hypothetical protein ACRDOP_03620 [Gaiellaceae bacterium]